MKKVKLFLCAVAMLTAASGIFAFKANKSLITGNIYTKSGSTYTNVEPTCYYPNNTDQLCNFTVPATATNYYYEEAGSYLPLTGGQVLYNIPGN